MINSNADESTIIFRDSHISYIKLSMIWFLIVLSVIYGSVSLSDREFGLYFDYAFFPEKAVANGYGGGLSPERVIEIMEKYPIDRVKFFKLFLVGNIIFIIPYICIFYLLFYVKNKPKIFFDRTNQLVYSYFMGKLYINEFASVANEENLYNGAWPPFHRTVRTTTRHHAFGPLMLKLTKYKGRSTKVFWLGEYPGTSETMSDDIRELVTIFMTDYDAKTEAEWEAVLNQKPPSSRWDWLRALGRFSLRKDQSPTLPKKIRKQLDEYAQGKGIVISG
ncbi:hypothetical protein Q4490_05740 [Neptunomonas phycophila]|uniref:Uncharacterized protein n=1 Tax=Neptunomonas phycophila TaxID=1572645 RepID=A0AAW7XFM1_9GAMM|nr:hypothetical protein [Neptunomonas phycophila]MDO6453059.1 hypothetical protein [Neptunomonas phycophila]